MTLLDIGQALLVAVRHDPAFKGSHRRVLGGERGPDDDTGQAKEKREENRNVGFRRLYDFVAMLLPP
jgi:hypothetical protein